MTYEQKKLKLAKLLIKDVISQLGRNCCNDIDSERFKSFTKAELRKLYEEFEMCNSKGEDMEDNLNATHLPDFAVAGYLFDWMFDTVKDYYDAKSAEI